MTEKTSVKQRRALTNEDLELLRTPDVELDRQCRVMSFDADRMQERISGSAWHDAIQAHLYFDHIVSKILFEGFPRPQSLQLERLSFAQKLDLAAASALIDADLIAFLRGINSLRNAIAHNLEFDVTEEEISKVLSRLPSRYARIVRNEEPPEQGVTLRKSFVVMTILLDLHRQGLVAQRLRGRKSELRLRAVLDHQPHVWVP